jgi:YhcH/YjgK/YiaL family protein
MIVDQLIHCDIYKSLSKNFSKAFEFLKKENLHQLETGKHVIDGDEIYMMVSEYETKLLSDGRWEAHKKYADIQLLLSGEELIGFAPAGEGKIIQEYNPDKDIMFLDVSGEYINLTPGRFAVFLPHDAHQPGITVNRRQQVKKIVIKVRV